MKWKRLVWFICSYSVYMSMVVLFYNIMSLGFTPDKNDIDIPWVIVDVSLTVIWCFIVMLGLRVLNKHTKEG